MDDYLAFPHVMVSFRDPRQSPIDARLAELGRKRSIAVTTPNFASNIASIRSTDLIMSLSSRVATNTMRADLIQFDLPLDVPDYPYSLLWHTRSDRDQAMIWLREVAIGISHQTQERRKQRAAARWAINNTAARDVKPVANIRQTPG